MLCLTGFCLSNSLALFPSGSAAITKQFSYLFIFCQSETKSGTLHLQTKAANHTSLDKTENELIQAARIEMRMKVGNSCSIQRFFYLREDNHQFDQLIQTIR